ncbi:MAG: hypothetical protein ISR58_12185 [Anaerolineales bacterium]|nr:hypothetical protein [Chloroflexota bacterium]MBL6981936.1 hypothetical protein [Anaerolineales bacterium]
MTEQQQPDLASQFREMGDNLKNMMKTAWQSEDAQKLRQDIKNGLSGLSQAANDAVDEFNTSEAGQRLKTETQDFRDRVRSGDVETKAREEISKVLHTINSELQKAIDQIPKSDPGSDDTADPEE